MQNSVNYSQDQGRNYYSQAEQIRTRVKSEHKRESHTQRACYDGPGPGPTPSTGSSLHSFTRTAVFVSADESVVEQII